MRSCSRPEDWLTVPTARPSDYGKRAFLNRAFVATGGWKAARLDPFLEPFSGGGDLPQGV